MKLVVVMALVLAGCQQPQSPMEGSREWREAKRHKLADNSATTNDESNDQPIGTAGTKTFCVSTPHNGRRYALDVDANGEGYINKIYFPKGGHVDFSDCITHSDWSGECDDENGKTWVFEGEGECD